MARLTSIGQDSRLDSPAEEIQDGVYTQSEGQTPPLDLSLLSRLSETVWTISTAIMKYDPLYSQTTSGLIVSNNAFATAS